MRRDERLAETTSLPWLRGRHNGRLDNEWNRVPPPKDVVNVGQAQDVILKYLRDNPLSWHVSAALLASAALFEAFPCK
jgi:Rap1a immunity proteins